MIKEYKLVILVMAVMAVYFLLVTPPGGLSADGQNYEGFAESLARGKIDFKSFYGFHGLSILSVPFFWLTGSHLSIAYTSMFLVLMSVPLIYLIARDIFNSNKAGVYGLLIFLMTPYPYTTLMMGFQEAALLFFILLIIYGSIHKRSWTPLVWAFGGIVKPFALVLLPLFTSDLWVRKKTKWFFLLGLAVGLVYLATSYYQVGHPINNAAINSYQGNFDTGNPPPLRESFTAGIKGFLRVGANLLLHFRKIMVSPLVIILGALALLAPLRLNLFRWRFNLNTGEGIRMRKEIILAIVLNFLLVGSLTFSFSKYLLPMTTLFALASVSYLLKYRWLMWLVFIDSFFVFLPIWNYFGHNFWPNIYIYLLPFWTAIAIFLFSRKEKLS
ncbi:MAG TPA: hypothetical protein VJ046_03680 [Candidatus Paceibacterota bacterium]|nr:hypothetical protein [Candidatus Paceibacterota bacterium]